jgi:hypothetical protein|tara:strand:- start:2498 stop:3247 length:750 start_codon:yes stop_codon:yes gene_type:complete
MEFTLPALKQQSFSKWFNKKVPRTDNMEERIVYPGIKLSCSTKSRDLRSEITPGHIFITYEKETEKFFHKVLGSNNQFALLPKRLYSHCFHNINIHSIPPNNRITVRLTESTSVILPYIPDDFVTQKRSKRGSMVRKTRGSVKKMKLEHDEQLNSQWNGKKKKYVGWVTQVLSPDTETAGDAGINGFRLKAYLRDKLQEYENALLITVPNPFADSENISDICNDPEQAIALTTVLHFLHHYGRNFLKSQ